MVTQTVSRRPWWKGSRGEWYVVVQVALLLLVFLGPRGFPGRPPLPGGSLSAVIGVALMIGGLLLLVAGGTGLGLPNLTPLPYPRERGVLVRTGVFGLVRHPMYGGGVILAFGWALVVHGWLTLLYAAVLFAFVDVKSRREEEWLTEKFPEYDDYRRHVRRLIPFVY